MLVQGSLKLDQKARWLSLPTKTNRQKAWQRMSMEVEQILAPLFKSTGERKEELVGRYKRVMEERNMRAEEMESEEIKEAVSIGKRLFLCQICGTFCFDGRFGPAVKFGLPGGFGKFQRYPAGDIREFVRNAKNKGLKLLPHSDFARRLEALFGEFDSCVQILDSHLYCAARERREAEAGRKPADHGLYTDVIRKKEIAEAMHAYTHEFFLGKEIIPIQFSYNPHRGCGYMGLETMPDLETILGGVKPSDVHGLEGVLEGLAVERRIISTWQLQKDHPFQDLFLKHSPEGFDLKHAYPKSILGFWRALDAIHLSLLPEIVDRLEKIYPKLPPKSTEMRVRAMLLLANAFISYLNNLHKFDYGEHTEEIIVVTEREYGPFETMSFPVFSLDHVNLTRDITIAAGIVRLNRSTQRIRGNTEDPVSILVQEIVRDKVAGSVWEELSKADFSSILFSEWWKNTLETEEKFRKKLTTRFPDIPVSVADAIMNLRHKMTVLYNPHLDTANNLSEGDLVVLPTIVDRSRRTRLVLPFVLNGY